MVCDSYRKNKGHGCCPEILIFHIYNTFIRVLYTNIIAILSAENKRLDPITNH